MERRPVEQYIHVSREPEVPMVRLADLPPPRKRALWGWIKANDAPLADWLDKLRDDPVTSMFGASPVLPLDYIRRAIG